VTELSFRTAAEEDLDRLIEIHTGAFPDARGPAQKPASAISRRIRSAIWSTFSSPSWAARSLGMRSFFRWQRGSVGDL
jgi:hypothetical protein